MKIQDIIAFLIISIPFFKMVVFDQNKLNLKKEFITYFFLGILSLTIGIIYYQLSHSENKWFVYFASQMTLVFLLLFNVVAIPFRKLFKRNPEISEVLSQIIDIVPTIIVIMGTILIPLFIDAYIIKFAIGK